MSLLSPVVIIGALIVVIGVIWGILDLARFSPRRVIAIASVCYTEAIRKRILLIAPLAIVGVVIVSQLQNATDEQDALRQTVKSCLFVSGLIVVATAIILACTNLPKEIESRVIFTIVTKPTTRFEIVIGKVVGFAQVSGVILLIMGLFTYGYLYVRAVRMQSRIDTALQAGGLDPAREATYRHFQRAGLLGTKSLEFPASLEVLAKPYDGGEFRWLAGAMQQSVSVPFSLTQDDADRIAAHANAGKPVLLIATIRLNQHPATAEEEHDIKTGTYARDDKPGADGKEAPLTPQVSFEILDPDRHPLGKQEVTGNNLITVPHASATTAPSAGPQTPGGSQAMGGSQALGGSQTVAQPLAAATLEDLIRARHFYIRMQTLTPTYEYGIGKSPIVIALVEPGPQAGPTPRIEPSNVGFDEPVPPASPSFLSNITPRGVQVRGQVDGRGSVADFRFEHADVPPARDGKIALQVKLNVERAGDLDATSTLNSEATIEILNRKTGKTSDPITLIPATGRATFVDVPADAFEGGDFDVLIRGKTTGQWLGVQGLTATTPSVGLVTADRTFSLNLFKSLFVLWLLSILVVVISVFCSTFLSWPIAVVLTLMMLMGRWAVEELGRRWGEARGAGSPTPC